jgi:hypothetical protein
MDLLRDRLILELEADRQWDSERESYTVAK